MTQQHSEATNTVIKFFNWINRIGANEIEVSKDDIAALWTSDGIVKGNGRVNYRGLDQLYRHTMDFTKKMQSWKFNLPFERHLCTGNEVATYYLVDFVDNEGNPGRVHDMAFWTIEDGKIKEQTEVFTFEDTTVDIEKY